ncbi:MAG: formate dehydrogenase subunit gamma [Paracoccaceae bacterium]|nr:formate dehydrogenase subunit gamma [Paracoccaceae bacterium]
MARSSTGFGGFLLLLALLFGLAGLGGLRDGVEVAEAPDRTATGGAPTLEDIMARQEGLPVDNSFRSSATGDAAGAGLTDPLGTLGGASDPDLWRALRFGTADVSASASFPGAELLVQDSGMAWLEFRNGPLKQWGGLGLLGTIGLLALFYGFRGRIRIDGEKAGVTIERFNSVERFAHWLLAGSFILLGITGLLVLFGRILIIPLLGHEANAVIAEVSKWVHNNVSWAFMIALVIVFFFWVIHNIPSRHDLAWLRVGGGLFKKGVHPPAKKFNAGQKVIFWSVILLGGSISASGLALLFPFEIQLFAKTFATLNALGLPGLLGMDPLPEVLTPHAEMQLSQAWHAIVSFVLMAIVIAHIYIGSLGMEGAYDAMGSGQVDLQWAKEHHGLWVEEMEAKGTAPSRGATPAE